MTSPFQLGIRRLSQLAVNSQWRIRALDSKRPDGDDNGVRSSERRERWSFMFRGWGGAAHFPGCPTCRAEWVSGDCRRVVSGLQAELVYGLQAGGCPACRRVARYPACTLSGCPACRWVGVRPAGRWVSGLQAGGCPAYRPVGVPACEAGWVFGLQAGGCPALQQRVGVRPAGGWRWGVRCPNDFRDSV